MVLLQRAQPRSIRISVLALAVALVVGSAAPPPISATTAPAVTAPRTTLKSGVQATRSRVPLTVSWAAATLVGSPLERYELETSRDGGAWQPVVLPSRRARSVTITLRAFAVMKFRLRAIDTAGATSAWAESAPVWLPVLQESDPAVELSPDWKVAAASTAFGGRRASTKEGGATARITFTGYAVAWISRQGPGAGEADVAISDGATAHVDLKRATWRPRRVVYAAVWPTAETRTLTITTTEPGAVVDVDGFVVLDTPRDATLVGAGDIASCTRQEDEATAALAATIDGIVFTTGDNVYPDGSADNFRDCYDPSWGALKSRTRPVVGNHEYANNPGAAAYFAYFGGAAGAPGKGWYRYDAGTWRIFVLNSECAGTQCSEQLAWLSSELDATPHRCVAAMWHKPRFSTGRHGDSTKMADAWRLLHERGAELVLTGHDHGYQRYQPLGPDGAADPLTGLREFVVGTGGASLYDFSTTSSLIDVRDNTSHGVLRLTLSPGGYAWQFLPVPADPFTDSGSATCH